MVDTDDSIAAYDKRRRPGPTSQGPGGMTNGRHAQPSLTEGVLDAMQAESMGKTSTGKGVTVAVVDTGASKRSVLQAPIW